MKQFAALFAFALCTLAAVAGTVVPTRISAVTLYADRARVHRAGEAPLTRRANGTVHYRTAGLDRR